VVTTGGLLGKVTEVGDSFVTIEIADGVRVKVQKFQVGSLMPKGTLKSA
jgi:preprotein translocase subunit YajC